MKTKNSIPLFWIIALLAAPSLGFLLFAAAVKSAKPAAAGNQICYSEPLTKTAR